MVRIATIICTLLTLTCTALGQSITPGDAASLRRAVESGPGENAKRFVIPPGEYHVDDTLEFRGWRDVEVVATGVTLVRTDTAKQGLRFVDCRGVTLRGGVLRCELLPFTQGEVVGFSADRKAIRLRLDPGYSPQWLAPTTGYAFDRSTRQWKPGTFDYVIESAVSETAVGPFLLRLKNAVGPELAAGDLMAFRGPVVQDVIVEGCERFTLDGLRIEGASGFAVHEAGGEGGNHYTYQLTYSTRHLNEQTAPLISANADAFHSSGVRRGPTLEGCSFEGMCDDGVAIHGYYGWVSDRVDDGIVAAFMWDRPFLRVGDPAHLFDDDGTLLGETSLVALEPMPDAYTPPTGPADDRFKGAKKFFRLRLADTAAVKSATRFSSPAANGGGFVVRGNVIKNHRARGVIVKASDGLIEKNVIDGSTIAAVSIGPELWWAEGCYSRDVTVRENVFRHAGYAHTGPWHVQAGVISVLGAGKQRDGARPLGYAHRNITIERNRFEASDGCQILVNGVAGLTIRGNVFDDVLRAPTDRGSDDQVDNTALIELRRVTDGRVSGNHVTRPGSALREPLRRAPTARDVEHDHAFDH